MANQFINLPAPAANAAGAAVDVSSCGLTKSIVVSGNWPQTQTPIVTIEINNDAGQLGSWTAIYTTQGGGQTSVDVACKWMRARTSNYTQGQAPEVDIGATNAGTTLAALPATPGDGAGAAIDVSALGQTKTIQVGGAFEGGVSVEVSQDGADWGQVMSVNGVAAQTVDVVARFMRVRRTGTPNINPGLPVVNVAAANPVTGGGGGLVAVTHDGTLTGTGTVGIPLGVVPSSLDNLVAVTSDGTTISGTGKAASALAVIPAGLAQKVSIATSGAELAGDGKTATPLHVVPASLGGEVPVAVDGTLSGNGTTGSPLHVLGSSQLTPVVTWAASFAAQTGKVNQYNGAAAVTATLPAANSVASGTQVTVKSSTSAGARVTLTPTGADVVLGERTVMMGGAVTAVSDGATTWLVVSYGTQQLGFVSVRTYGATGDGATDDRAAIQSAIAAAIVLGAEVYFPPGTYAVGRSGANAWALTMSGGSNVLLRGVKGASWIKLLAGQTILPCPLLLIDTVANITIRDLGFDGNWGNAATTIAAASNTAVLPQATINVKDTTGFPAAGAITVVSSTGPQTVNYTGVTPTSFTGCTGGGGFVLTGNNVGYSDSQAGLNQTTQGDPQSHGLMIRGCNNVLIDNVLIKQAYGDGIWIGASSTDFTNGFAFQTQIVNTSVNMCARDCVSLAQIAQYSTIRDCYLNNAYQNIIDVEPIGDQQYDRGLTIDNCEIGGWWNQGNPARNANYSIALSGGETSVGPSQTNAVRKMRLINNTIRGSVALQTAYDVVIQSNRIICNWIGDSAGGINCFAWMDHVLIEDNEIYVSTLTQGGVQGSDCISVEYYGAGQTNIQPLGVQIVNNRLSPKNGALGIVIDGVGGHDYLGVLVPGVAGVSTATTANTMTDGGAAWTVSQWIGYFVRCGNATGTVTANTATQLSVDNWCTPFGIPTATPAPGSAYEIMSGGGMIDIDSNVIDCTDDGNGHGGYGIEYTAQRAGGRIRIRGNTIKNANVSAIYVDSQFRTTVSAEITNNHAWDNQVVPTCLQNIQFNYPQNITKLIMRGNTTGDGVAQNVSGINGVSWLQPVGLNYFYMHDGYPEELAGFVSPEGNVPAHIGATYHLMSGGLRSLWSKQFDDGLNTGWNPLAVPTIPAWTVDKTSGIGIPQNTTEWNALIASAGLTGIVNPPDAIWTCQDAAGGGKLVDATGTYDLTEFGGVGYRQVIPGWSSLGATTGDNTSGGWENTNPALPDLSTGNLAMFCYAYQASTISNIREIMALGTGAAPANISYIGGGAATRATSGNNIVAAAGSQFGIVRPYGILSVAGVRARGFDDINKLSPALAGTIGGKRMALGGTPAVISPSSCAHLYAWAWLAANVPSDANIKKIYQTLGWDVIWT